MATVKVVIAGCRDYCDYDEAKKFIDDSLSNINNENSIVVLSGGANGADKLGIRYAEENGFQVKLFLPQWDKYGKSAGPKRNKLMAQECDLVICFWDSKSRGTKSMIEYAKQFDKLLFIKQI